MKALEVLQEVAGPCSPVLFLKMGRNDWVPVGEENFLSDKREELDRSDRDL
jgi:hypothetical protein